MPWNFKPKRLQAFSVFAIFASVSVCHADLVAHYKFDELPGATTAVNAVTANGGNGVIGANVTLGAAGVSGAGFMLNNGATQADIVDMGNATSIFSKITASGQITLSYWIKSTDVSGGRNVAVFMGNDTATNSYIDSGIAGGAGPNPAPGSAYGRNRVATNAAANIGEQFGPLVNNDVFNHIALSIDTASNTSTLYVNGAIAATETSAAKYTAFPAFNNFEIGRLGRSAPTDAFGGVMDDLQVYDRSLSRRHISAIFNNPGKSLNELPPIVDGDTNGDGLIDAVDFNNIRNSLGYAGLTPGLGVDIAGNDGIIDFRDLRFFQQKYPAVAAAALGEAIPEPASLALGAFAVVAAAGISRRHRV
jgi:hypothetical protein